jgi:hypothetical protein
MPLAVSVAEPAAATLPSQAGGPGADSDGYSTGSVLSVSTFK